MTCTSGGKKTLLGDAPELLLEKLFAGPVPGVSSIDVPALQARVLAALSGFEVEAHTAEQIMLQREAGGAFDLQWSPQWVSASAYGDVSGDDWNAIIDVMNAAGMAVYDPQMEERFLQPDLPE